MSASKAPLVFLSRDEVKAALPLANCISVVESAFRNHAEGKSPVEPGVLGSHLHDGGFHVKTAALGEEPCYFAAKINGNFPLNPERCGLPTIQGLLLLFDGRRGTPLAVMDSIEITILRTAAASAVAAKYLARADARSVTICGCGNQGRSHLRALALMRPLTRAFALDVSAERARSFAIEMTREMGFEVTVAHSLADAMVHSDICATCTTSKQPLVSPEMLHPGLFIAAVGADNPEKQEIAPEALRASRVVTDLTGQAAAIGDLRHAIAAGLMRPDDVHAELGQILARQRPGRSSEDEVFVFDSTGTALQDVAAAALVYERVTQPAPA